MSPILDKAAFISSRDDDYYAFTCYLYSMVTQHSFILRLINSFRRIFCSSEKEFLEILTILKSNPKTAQKLHKAMIKELYNSMNDDLEDILKEGSLQETLVKIDKLSEENTTTNKHAWSVDSVKNRFVSVISYLRIIV